MATAVFEDGRRGPRAKECEPLLEAGKNKKIDSPSEYPQGI